MCRRRVHFTDKPSQSAAGRPSDGKKAKESDFTENPGISWDG